MTHVGTFIDKPDILSSLLPGYRFGGNGSDGDLVVSGTTNLISGKVYQYSSITIQNGGVLTHAESLFECGTVSHLFTYPLLILCSGNVDIQSGGKIDLKGKGGLKGPCANGGGNANGPRELNHGGIASMDSHVLGIFYNNAGHGAGGTGGGAYKQFASSASLGQTIYAYGGLPVHAGWGGFDYAGGTNAGDGGGSVFLEVAGSIIIAGDIDCRGNDATGTPTYGAGGGGGGAIYIRHAGSYSVTGTLDVTKGTGVNGSIGGTGCSGSSGVSVQEPVEGKYTVNAWTGKRF